MKFQMKFQIGLNSISSYKRLAYTPWHAIAEFVDNSTQSYFDNQKHLDALAHETETTPLLVTIEYSRKKQDFPGSLVITDNAMGMSFLNLERAMHVALPPENASGRSQYGMGLKTAASWMGNCWKIKTKKLGESVEYNVEVDVKKIANDDNILNVEEVHNRPENEHYTIIEVVDHNQKFSTRTLSKIKTYLSSMYRVDLRENILTLRWGDEALMWKFDDEKRILESETSGDRYKTKFQFVVEGDENEERVVRGWVGILRSGSRAYAGFSILHADRVIKGYPDSWRPYSLFGQDQGTNDLVNQRLFGEIHLNDFDVSHTKDQIAWKDDEEEQVNEGLREQCWGYREIARDFRLRMDDQRGPTETQVDTAISELKGELHSKHLTYWAESSLLLTSEMISELKKLYVKSVVEQFPATFQAQISEDLLVRGFVKEASVSDPYLVIDRPKPGQIDVIINKSHLHWYQLRGSAGVLNYLRHCVYDGIAEFRAQNQLAHSIEIDPDTIKMIKDALLRLPFKIEQYVQQRSTESSDQTEGFE